MRRTRPPRRTTSRREGRRYNHWSFAESFQLLAKFIVDEALDFGKAQKLFPHRGVNACRVKWMNDMMRFNAKGVPYNWKTFLVGVVLDFHALVAVKTHPLIAPCFPRLKARLLAVLYSVDYLCFITSADYRGQVCDLIVATYKKFIPLDRLETSGRTHRTSEALHGFAKMLQTGSFKILSQMPADSKAHEQLARDVRRKAAKLIIE